MDIRIRALQIGYRNKVPEAGTGHMILRKRIQNHRLVIFKEDALSTAIYQGRRGRVDKADQ